VNESWSTINTVRRFALGLYAVFWGIGMAAAPARARLLSALLLVSFALLTAPFEIAALAASYAAAPVLLVLLLGMVTPVAIYGLALLLAILFRRIRLGRLALVPVTLSLAGLVYADQLLQVQLFSPLVPADSGAWPHVLLAGTAALLTLVLLITADLRSTAQATAARSGS
jgi:hypothetical protein